MSQEGCPELRLDTDGACSEEHSGQRRHAAQNVHPISPKAGACTHCWSEDADTIPQGRSHSCVNPIDMHATPDQRKAATTPVQWENTLASGQKSSRFLWSFPYLGLSVPTKASHGFSTQSITGRGC